ncbi:MAG TPA: uroporphyrinogen-III synthase [Stellaceae bacterium]|nr:uroporphyrinogen-III synthase [Stellaceae bacterium]
MTMRALVTRPRLQAETFAAELARRGVEPVVEPLIEIADCLAALPQFAGVQAILCTSVNGVRALARATGDRQAPVFAVGDATARAARTAGFERVESAGGDVGDLARLVCGRLRPGGGRLLHVAGSAVAGDLAGRLGASGFAVERAVLYQAHAVAALTPATARLIERGEIDLALFFSPRTAAVFARLVVEAAAAPGLAATAALSISRAADAALGDLRFRERAVAGAPTQAALVALVDQFARQPA